MLSSPSNPNRNGEAWPCRGTPRIALYSHDTQGLGHVRRNLLIARSLVGREHRPVVLVLSGVHEATSFGVPPGIDILTLPALAKDTNGAYAPRSLSVSTRHLVHLRTRTIQAALRSFQPDLLVVDKVPLGAFAELLPTLKSLRGRRRARLVFGMREVLDDPESVRRDWAADGSVEVLREFYDRIWVYGDPAVYDPVQEYGLPPDVAARVRYAGYLSPLDVEDPSIGLSDEDPLSHLNLLPGPIHLCVVGGGRDGLPLAEAFLRADLPPGSSGVLVTGPLMSDPDRAALRALAARGPRRRVLEFVTNPCPLLRRADRVIAMGGYNTVCEIVSMAKDALIVPRVRPRTEQLIRAGRFQKLGLLDLLHPDDLRPEAISRWLAAPRITAPRAAIDFGAVARLPELLREVLTGTSKESARVAV